MAQKQVSLLKLINPSERQLKAIQAVANFDFVLYGGAAGGGKSYWLRWCLIWLLIEMHRSFGLRNVTVMLASEDYPSLYDRQISKMQTEFPPWLGKLKMGDNKNFQLAEQFGGGIIALRNLNDPSKYLSAEFAAIAVDELTKNTKKVFDFLRLRLRWPGVERPKFLGGTNPGGEGHAWVKDLWIERSFPKELHDLAPQFSFVPALATDNPHLTKGYWNQLRTLPEEMQKIYVEGRWDIFAGQYFGIFGPDSIARPETFELKGWTTRWIAIDWGFKHPASVHWFAQISEDVTCTYREKLEIGLTPLQLAEAIVKLTDTEDISAIYLSPDAFANRLGSDTIAQQMDKMFKEAGLPPCTPAENHRESGWAMMYEYLRSKRWIIGDNCPHLIKTLPMMTRDEKHIEDCVKFNASDGRYDGDDAADSARYGIRSHFKEAPLPREERIHQRVEALDNINHKMMMQFKAEHEERASGPRVIKLRRGIRGFAGRRFK